MQGISPDFLLFFPITGQKIKKCLVSNISDYSKGSIKFNCIFRLRKTKII